MSNDKQKKAVAPAETENAPVQVADESTLVVAETVDPDAMLKDELADEAESRGLSSTGTKAEIADRINEDIQSGEYKPEVQFPKVRN